MFSLFKCSLREWFILILLLAIPSMAFGQSTTVSGQVTDSAAQAWNNGTYSFQFIPNPSNPNALYLWSGGVLNQTISGSLNATGGYSQSVPSNTSITPSGSTWRLQVCSGTTPVNCFTVTQTITGGTQTVNVTPPPVVVPPGAGNTAYNTNEVSPAIIGSQIYIIGTGLQLCSAVGGGTCTTWSGSSGSTSSPSPVVGWYLGPNCTTANIGQCFNSPANLRTDNTCSWTNASTTITCTDAPFSSSDVGKLAWGSSGTGTGNAGCNPYQLQPQAAYITTTHVTILSITDTSHAVISATPAVTSSNNTSCFEWGTPDDAGAAALWTAINAATSCPRVTMQAGNYLFTAPPEFMWDQPVACANLPAVFPFGTGQGGFGNMWYGIGYEVEGRGVGPTQIFVPPDFPETGSCNHGYTQYLSTQITYTGACFAVPSEGFFHDFAIGSGSGRYGLPSNSAMLNVGVGTLERVTCFSAGDSVPNTIGLVVSVQAQIQQVNISSCGSTGIWVDSSTASGIAVPYTFPSARAYRLSVDQSTFDNMQIMPGAQFSCDSCLFFGTVSSAGIASILNRGGTLFLRNTSFVQQTTNLASTAYQAQSPNSILHAETTQFLTGSHSTSATIGIKCNAACTNYLHDTVLNGTGTGQPYVDVAGSILYDLGGNSMIGTSPSISGAVVGDDSITGTAITAAKLVLGAGWGTTAAWTVLTGNTRLIQGTITASGTGQLANPTITYTFPTPFWSTSNLICSATQVGGTQAAIANPFTPSSLSATGVTFTYNNASAPGAGNTLIVQISCGAK